MGKIPVVPIPGGGWIEWRKLGSRPLSVIVAQDKQHHNAGFCDFTDCDIVCIRLAASNSGMGSGYIELGGANAMSQVVSTAGTLQISLLFTKSRIDPNAVDFTCISAGAPYTSVPDSITFKSFTSASTFSVTQVVYGGKYKF